VFLLQSQTCPREGTNSSETVTRTGHPAGANVFTSFSLENNYEKEKEKQDKGLNEVSNAGESKQRKEAQTFFDENQGAWHFHQSAECFHKKEDEALLK